MNRILIIIKKKDEYTSWLTICLTSCLRSWQAAKDCRKYANFKKTLKKFVTDGNLQPSTQKENRKLCQKTATIFQIYLQYFYQWLQWYKQTLHKIREDYIRDNRHAIIFSWSISSHKAHALNWHPEIIFSQQPHH